MKIWVVGRGYPTKQNRMWGLFEFEQAKILASHGHEVCYLALTLSFFRRGDVRGLSEFVEEGVHVLHASRLFFPGKIGIYIPQYEDNCWKVLARKAEELIGFPDVIHVHYPAMIGNINVIESYHRRGSKLIATEHWSRVLAGQLKKPDMERLSYYARNADYFSAVSDALLEAVSRVVRIEAPSGVLPNSIASSFVPKSIPHSGFQYLVVGRLEPIKQIDSIISAFQEAFSGEEDIRLRIVGSGTEAGKLKKLVRKGHSVSFAGSLSVSEVAEEMACCDALISYSKYETFGVPIIEAWASGKPAIVSDSSGVASYMTDDLGLVVDHENIEELVLAMRQLKNNADSYSAESIAELCVESFGSERLYQRLMSCYL